MKNEMETTLHCAASGSIGAYRNNREPNGKTSEKDMETEVVKGFIRIEAANFGISLFDSMQVQHNC